MKFLKNDFFFSIKEIGSQKASNLLKIIKQGYAYNICGFQALERKVFLPYNGYHQKQSGLTGKMWEQRQSSYRFSVNIQDAKF